MAKALKTPLTFAEALRLAADLAEQNEKLERQLAELRLNGNILKCFDQHIFRNSLGSALRR